MSKQNTYKENRNDLKMAHIKKLRLNKEELMSLDLNSGSIYGGTYRGCVSISFNGNCSVQYCFPTTGCGIYYKL
jgi:hypothetical protein